MTEATEHASIQFTESPETDLLIVSFDDISKDDGSFFGWNLYVEFNRTIRLIRVTRFDPTDEIQPVFIDLPNDEKIFGEIIQVVDRFYLKIKTADQNKLELCKQVTPTHFLPGSLTLPL